MSRARAGLIMNNCNTCRQHRRETMCFIDGEPVYQDRCALGAPGYPDLGPDCQWFDGAYPWGADFFELASEIDP